MIEVRPLVLNALPPFLAKVTLTLPVALSQDDDDDYGATTSSSSQRPNNKRTAPSSSSGPHKRVLRVDIDDDDDQDAGTRASTAKRPASKIVDIPPEDFERLVKDIVRLAIFSSHSEQPLRRDDIRESKRICDIS